MDLNVMDDCFPAVFSQVKTPLGVGLIIGRMNHNGKEPMILVRLDSEQTRFTPDGEKIPPVAYSFLPHEIEVLE